MDGGIGHGKNNIFGTLNQNDSLEIDKYKDEQALKHGITVIRIDSDYGILEKRFEYIKHSILLSNLKKYIDLSGVDWEDIYKKTNSSIMLDFITYVNSIENKDKSIETLCEEFGIPRTSGRRYVQRAIEQGLCNYQKKDCRKQIAQYSLSGNFIKKYNSIQEAVILNNYNSSSQIIRCLQECGRSAYGYQWKYYYGNNSNIKPLRKSKRDYSNLYKRVAQYSLQGDLIAIYESVTQASTVTGIGRSAIGQCCNKKSKTSGGYIWKYADEVENNSIVEAV